jgi:DNA invertase Pin-like site-specific DNA recombinase
MKLGGYTRVSTDGQIDGYGLDSQRHDLKTWARAHREHRIVEWFSDEGISGTLAERDGLGEVIDAIGHGRIAGVVIPRLDRLARDVIVQEQLLLEIARLGGVVFSTSAGEAGYLTDDPDDPSRKLIRQVLGAVNGYEREMIALRLRKGRQRKAERGGFAYGSPSYGVRAEGGELVADDHEQAVIRRAVELRAEGASLRQIADALDAEGHRAKRGGRWHPNAVRRVLERHNAAA